MATTTGDVNVWAGVVLPGKPFLPLARQVFSSAPPHLTSQQKVEKAVLAAALDRVVLPTTLPIALLAEVKGVVRVSAWRWSIETGFETLKALGLGRCMVRKWQANDRRLWIVAVAYALLAVAARDGPLAIFRQQAIRLLKRLAVLGRRLAVGKLAEAIGLDYRQHRRAWSTAWMTTIT